MYDFFENSLCMKKVIACLALVAIFFSCENALAKNENAFPKLDVLTLVAVKKRADAGSTSKLITINSFNAHETLRELSVLKGTAEETSSLFLFLVGEDGTLEELGGISAVKNKPFVLATRPIPQAFKGEVTLLVSSFPDPRLAFSQESKWQALAFVLDPELDIVSPQGSTPLGLSIDTLEFSQAGQSLPTNNGDFLEVMDMQKSGAVIAHISGKIFTDKATVVTLTSIVIPSLDQVSHDLSTQASSAYSLHIPLSGMSAGEPIQIILTAQGKGEGEEKNKATLVRSFQITPAGKTSGSFPSWQKIRIQKKYPDAPPPLTLTTLSEDLEVSPALAASWSAISATSWEFSLRSPDSESLAKRIQEKMKGEVKASAKDPSTLEVTTKHPDPLLPQKLSLVNLKSGILASPEPPGTVLYAPLEAFPDHTLGKRNEKAYELPFLRLTAPYQEIVFERNHAALSELIDKRTVDIFDEPEIALWPKLSRAGYTIVPKMNAQIVVLMVNRNNFFLNDKTSVLAMRGALQNSRVLETSYFQYGRLGTQFAPPGVVGYFPKINLSKNVDNLSQVVADRETEFGIHQISLKLHYPAGEKLLASVVEGHLEQAGLNIIPVEIPDHRFEQELTKKLPDLVLVPITYQIGDISPFLDTFIDSSSPINGSYSNKTVDELLQQQRTELNGSKRLKLLNHIMQIITEDDPAGIPLLFKRSFRAKKT